MADFTFSDDVAEELHNLARHKGRSVEDVVREMIRQYKSTETAEEREQDMEPRPGSGAALLKSALAANIRSEHRDTAARSREILDKEFPEYLRQRMNRPAVDDESE